MRKPSKKLLISAFGYRWYCVGCKTLHLLPVAGHRFDGCSEEPTFHPAFEHHEGEIFCRYNIVGGKVQYSLECTHLYRGRSLIMPDVPTEFVCEP